MLGSTGRTKLFPAFCVPIHYHVPSTREHTCAAWAAVVCVLCATHCCEIRQRGGVSLSASRGPERRSQACRARTPRYLVLPTDGKKCFISKPFPTRHRVALERQVSVNWRGGESASQDAICLSEKVVAPPSLRSSVFDARVTCEKLLGMTKVDTFRLVKRVFPRGKWRKVTLDSLRTLR